MRVRIFVCEGKLKEFENKNESEREREDGIKNQIQRRWTPNLK